MSYSICFSPLDLLHLVWSSLGPTMLLHDSDPLSNQNFVLLRTFKMSLLVLWFALFLIKSMVIIVSVSWYTICIFLWLSLRFFSVLSLFSNCTIMFPFVVFFAFLLVCNSFASWNCVYIFIKLEIFLNVISSNILQFSHSLFLGLQMTHLLDTIDRSGGWLGICFYLLNTHWVSSQWGRCYDVNILRFVVFL